MGKRARDFRKATKAFIRRNKYLGFVENDFGELKYKGTKEQARRRLAGAILFRLRAEREVIDLAVKRAMEDITAVEDARILAELDSLSGAVSSTPVVL